MSFLTSCALVRPALAHAAEPEAAVVVDRLDAVPPPSTKPKLILGGLALTGLWYGASIGLAQLWPDQPHGKDLWIPVAGPWMALANTGCDTNGSECAPFVVGLRAVLTTLTGLGQLGGLGLVTQGLVLRTEAPRNITGTARRVTWTPYLHPVAARGVGLGVMGQF